MITHTGQFYGQHYSMAAGSAAECTCNIDDADVMTTIVSLPLHAFRSRCALLCRACADKLCQERTRLQNRKRQSKSRGTRQQSEGGEEHSDTASPAAEDSGLQEGFHEIIFIYALLIIFFSFALWQWIPMLCSLWTRKAPSE
jgi:hypothetical protein